MVQVTVMLVTSLCWWHRYVGDFMMVTDFRCRWQNRYVCDFLNVLNRSPTSQTCHQHICSPTSVTTINVTDGICSFYSQKKSSSNRRTRHACSPNRITHWSNALLIAATRSFVITVACPSVKSVSNISQSVPDSLLLALLKHLIGYIYPYVWFIH